MHFFEVIIADAAYHGNEALTYSHTDALQEGSIVIVPLRSKLVLGLIARQVPQPQFAAKAIHSVADLPALPEHLLKLMEWLRAYYPSPYGIIAQLLLPSHLPKKPVDREVMPPILDSQLPPLTTEQETVLESLLGSVGTSLLHGDTGTGKTRVYIELAKQCLAKDRSAIILTPEIGLTSQLTDSFTQIFGKRVILVHSQLTEVARSRLWVRILQATFPLIIIGPRSALFSPLRDIGLIVVDEAHETAYKQDQAPYYHTSRVASKLAELNKAMLVLGSATPLVTDYFIAETKKRPILRMQQNAKATNNDTRDITVVDLRDRSEFSKSPYLSTKLITELKARLANNEQSLLFLNRRGTARVILCEQCGWQAVCPHCDIPLVYHGDTHRMRCHSCEYSAVSPSSCPDCHNASVVFKSIGTKAVVDEVSRLFPDARVMRFDTDNKKSERMEQHFGAIKAGDVDILIGTQTLAKGLDLPKLSLVGVILADTSLYFPDFSAQERTYQLLSQVIGRVGRGHRAGKVILQTYSPDSALLKAIIEKDWQGFYQQELHERQAFTFPPYCYLLKLSCRRASYKGAESTAAKLAAILRSSGLRIMVEGPAPSFHEKFQNKYQWQIVVKTKDRTQLLEVIQLLPSGWTHDIDPMDLL